MKTITDLLRNHPFFQGMAEKDLALLGGCGKNQVWQTNEYIARENTPADYFYLIRGGRAAIETALPNRPPLRLQTLQSGDILGWSWLFPPYRWCFDIRALETLHATALDGICLREKCREDPRLGYDLMQRFARIMTERLQATRLQLMDVYGTADHEHA